MAVNDSAGAQWKLSAVNVASEAKREIEIIVKTSFALCRGVQYGTAPHQS